MLYLDQRPAPALTTCLEARWTSTHRLESAKSGIKTRKVVICSRGRGRGSAQGLGMEGAMRVVLLVW